MMAVPPTPRRTVAASSVGNPGAKVRATWATPTSPSPLARLRPAPTRSTTSPERIASGTYVSGTAPATTPASVPESPSSREMTGRYAGSVNQQNVSSV